MIAPWRRLRAWWYGPVAGPVRLRLDQIVSPAAPPDRDPASSHIADALARALADPELAREFARAIDYVLVEGNGQSFWLARSAGDRPSPPLDASLADGIRHYGSPPSAPLDLWRICRAHAALDRVWREVWRRAMAEASAVPAPAPVDRSAEPVGPDEGLGVVADPNHLAAADQIPLFGARP